MVDSKPTVGQKVESSGKEYQYEIMVYRDDKPGGNICVIGNAEDGGWRVFIPLGSSFIKTPDNTFIGE